MSNDLKEDLSSLHSIEREEISKAFRDVFRNATGKRVLFWILEQCAVYRDAYTGDNNATNYTLGLQAAGRTLIAKLDEIDPQMYPNLLLAMNDIREADKAEARSRAEQMEPEDDDEAI